MNRTEEPTQPVEPEGVARRAAVLFDEQLEGSRAQTDRMFAGLLLAQWVFAVLIAAVYSPYGWAGKATAIHLHVQLAIGLGLLINSVPLLLIRFQPGKPTTRYVIAAAQMLWSALLIHLTGGRIETHFHVFGSLAFLAFYRDWKVLVPATVVVATDHVVRQFLYPESVYGIANPEWWRFIEHALWVVFEDSVLVYACIRGVLEVKDISDRTAQLEALRETERQKSKRLDEALQELRTSQEALVRTEKLAAVGQLAASVGHELRNPLAAVQNAHTYMNKRLAPQIEADPRLRQFSQIIDKELAATTRIISDLLDFARDRPPSRGPCPLRTLVDDAIAIVPPSPGVTIVNEVPEALPVPSLDRDQFRQVIVNLVQNACEAMGDGGGAVRIGAEGGDDAPWIVRVADEGPGMPPDVVARVFQPLFTTKTKGTGLGLAIVSGIVQRHDGTIRVHSEPGRGTTFTIELPALAVAAAV